MIGLKILPYGIETFPILSCSLKTRYEDILTNYETSLVQLCDLAAPLVLILHKYEITNLLEIQNNFFLYNDSSVKEVMVENI